MKTEWKEISPTRKSLRVEIPAETVDAKVKDTLQKLSSTVTLPGFRPGKAPISMLKARFKKEIKEEVLGDLAPDIIKKALDEEKLDPVDDPKMEEVEFKDGEPLVFTASIEVVPPFDLPEYKGLALTREKVETDDEELDTILEKMRDDVAQWAPVEGRSAAEKDLIHLDLGIAFQDGDQEPVQHNDLPFVLGDSNLPPEVVETITGMKQGETKSTKAFTYPEDWYDAKLAGKKVVATVVVKEIKVKDLPDLDDEFGKMLAGKYGKKDITDLAGFREALRADVLEEKESRRERALKEKALAKAAEKVEVEIPQSLIERELQVRMEEIAMGLSQQGIDVRSANLDWNKMREEHRDGAVDAVRQQLVANRIGTEEKLTVDEKELDKRLTQIALQTGETLEQIKERLAEDGRLGRLRDQAQRDAVVDFIIANANITEEA